MILFSRNKHRAPVGGKLQKGIRRQWTRNSASRRSWRPVWQFCCSSSQHPDFEDEDEHEDEDDFLPHPL
jgi:hypothetical protein